jgi:hypothetical protein
LRTSIGRTYGLATATRQTGQARGKIYGFTGDGEFRVSRASGTARNNFTARDSDVSGNLLIHRPRNVIHCAVDRQRRRDCPMHVVTVCKRGDKHDHCTVPDVLIDASAKIGDDTVNLLEENRQQDMDVLGVELVAQGREPGDVGEQHRYLSALA